MLNFPVWEIPYLGGGLLIAIVATIHVFIAHFAVGGGLFLVMTERRAYREHDERILEYVQRHSRFFLLLTLVLGAVTGVGIWFTIGLVSPAATSSLINIFVWGWAIEWVFFFIEIAAIIVYYYTWRKLQPRIHLAVGWIYFIAAWMSLFVINGIVAFMLTPGAWTETRAFIDGFFNPTYWPALVSRTLVCFALAGIYAILTSSVFTDRELRGAMVRYAATWSLPALVLLPFSLYWYYAALPDVAREILTGGLPFIYTTAVVSIVAGIALFILVSLAAWFFPSRVPVAYSILLLLVGFTVMFSAERVREAIRKPYVLYDYMYTHAVLKGAEESVREEGILKTWAWGKYDEVSDATLLRAGKDIFRAQCMACHTIGGYNNVLKLVEDYTADDLEIIVLELDQFRGYMPPFAGTYDEARAVAEYLMSVKTEQSGDPTITQNGR
jgi:cytochrome bd-type quinol oxidase subunit 1